MQWKQETNSLLYSHIYRKPLLYIIEATYWRQPLILFGLANAVLRHSDVHKKQLLTDEEKFVPVSAFLLTRKFSYIEYSTAWTKLQR